MVDKEKLAEDEKKMGRLVDRLNEEVSLEVNGRPYLLVLATLYALTRWEWARLRKSRFKSVTIHATGHIELLGGIRAALARHGAEVQDFEVQKHDGHVVLQLAVRLSVSRQEDVITQDLMALPGVSRVAWGMGS